MNMLNTVLLVSAMTVAAAVAQPGPGDGPHGKQDGDRAPRREQAMEKLGLTQEQRDGLEALRTEARKQMIDLRANVEKARIETKRLMDQSDSTPEAVMQALEAESAAQLAMRKSMAEQHFKVRDLIGPEKADQLRAMREQHRGDRGDRGERGMRGNRDDDHGPRRGPGPDGDDD